MSESKNEDERVQIPNIGKLFSRICDLKQMDTFYRTSSRLQIGGAFKPTRVFGGQAVAQAYIAACNYRKDCLPLRMDLIFYGAGSTIKPIDYFAEMNDSESMHMQILAKQENKLLNSTNFRLERTDKINESRLKQSFPRFPKKISNPEDLPTLEEVLKKIYIEDWLLKNGATHSLRSKSKLHKPIFELRIPDPFHFSGQNDENKPLSLWLRLEKDLREIKLKDKMVIPLLISDYIVGLPSTIAFDQRRILIKTMASMTHKVIFHSDNFDPYDYFLVVENVEHLQGMALMRGEVFSRQGIPILSYVQQSYFEISDKLSKI